jgi:hypothetical protein
MGEEREHLVHAGPVPPPGPSPVRPDVEVLLHAQAAEDPSPFGHERDPGGDALVGGHPAQRAPVVADVSRADLHRAGDRPHERRLAGPIGADRRHRAPLGDLHRHLEQGAEVPVVGVEPVDLEEHHSTPR